MNTVASVAGNMPLSVSTPSLAGRGPRAAKEFEANLIGSLLESLEKTFAALPGSGELAGADDYNYLGTRALAEGIADRGGFGIAALITNHLGDARR